MKAGMKTVLRTAAWSTSALLLMGAAAGTASAVTAHNHRANNRDTTGSSDTASARPHLLHDLATVEAADGSFEQYASQMGTVSAVTDSSITVVSADKYSATYVIDDGTKLFKDGAKATTGDIANGDTVFVRAEDEDGTFTADVIGDGKPPARGPRGHRPAPGPGAPGGPGAPAAPGAGAGGTS